MTAALDLYESLLHHISNTTEVFQCIPKTTPVGGVMMWEGHSPRKNPEGRLHSMEIVFPGDLNQLAMFLMEHNSSIALPVVNTKASMIQYLQSFIENRQSITNLFEYFLSNPMKGYEHDYNQVTTYASCLLSHATVIKERSKYICEQFERLILFIDSESAVETKASPE